MYAKNPEAKYLGALSMGILGEIAGLQRWFVVMTEIWLKYLGALSMVEIWFARAIKNFGDMITTDLGLRQVLAPNGELLQKGDTYYNIELAHTLEATAEYGPQAFYNGTVGESFVKDVTEASGILTMEDLRSYKVKVMDAVAVDVMGSTILGMPPPSSGTVGLSLRVDEMMDFAASEPIGSLGFGKWDKLKSSYCRKDHQFAYLSFIGSFLANFLRTPLASEVDGDIVLYF
ncbi:hypothetical protein IFM89_024452 [Coptis chinensis]|uniref:Uncharacterized protein n=1 Tax=Coptis chinensis TaxID=261450 RepID=A0A835LGA4_9MAGN|nr:hypothetical protein IFM89_024452 [Coptis chinensis]